jgi:hypothetical protein
VAWHEFVDGGAQVRYVVVQNGVPGSPRSVPDSYARQVQPSGAATAGGYLLAYLASDGARDVVRAVDLDVNGAPVAGPDTITAPGASGSVPKVAAFGSQEAFAWIGAQGHHVALRGPETLGPTAVGTTLASPTLLNVPRIALDANGTLFVAYRDGGTQPTDWDVLLVTRPARGAFGAVVNVSKSPGSTSDDVAVALEPDGSLDIVWVEQDAIDPRFFEVSYSVRSPSGALTAPARFGNQGAMMWMPAVVPGLRVAWNGGGGGVGPLFSARPGAAPAPLLPALAGNQISASTGTTGLIDLAFVENTQPRRITYARIR